jgi:hypothetical protein
MNIEYLRSLNLNDKEKEKYIYEAIQVLLAFDDKNKYIIFPQTLGYINYYSRSQLEEDLIELRHFYLEQTK